MAVTISTKCMGTITDNPRIYRGEYARIMTQLNTYRPKPNNIKFVTSSSSKLNASLIKVVSVSSIDLKKWNYHIWKYGVLGASSLIEVMLMNMKYKNEWVVKTSYLIICQINQRGRLINVSFRILYSSTLYV